MSKLQFFKHLLQLTEKKIQTQLKPNYFTTPSMGQFSNLRICLWKSLRLLKQNLLQVDAQLWYEEAFQDVSSSVCHTPVFCGHRWTNPQIFITSGSPAILVLSASNTFTKFRRGIKISRFSTNKSLYLANNSRYRHSYYGRLVGNHLFVIFAVLDVSLAVN